MGNESVCESDYSTKFYGGRIQIEPDSGCCDSFIGDPATQGDSGRLLVGRGSLHSADPSLDDVQLDVYVSAVE